MPFRGVARGADAREALGQAGGGDAGLEAGERGAEAEMDAVAERQMRVGIAVEIQSNGSPRRALASMSSSSMATMLSTLAARFSTAVGVKALVNRRRRRVWSGGSRSTIR